MYTEITMPYARFRWYKDIVPMSQVRNIELAYNNSTENGTSESNAVPF